MISERNMVRVRNTRPANICGLGPGATGEVDANRPGVAQLLKLGWLRTVDAAAPASPQEPPAPDVAGDLPFLVAELEQRNQQLRDDLAIRDEESVNARGRAASAEERAGALQVQLDAVVFQNGELFTRASSAEAESASLRTERDTLKRDLAAAQELLAAATAPPPSPPEPLPEAPSDPPPPPAPPSKPRK